MAKIMLSTRLCVVNWTLPNFALNYWLSFSNKEHHDSEKISFIIIYTAKSFIIKFVNIL
jgi:hypothetical protein